MKLGDVASRRESRVLGSSRARRRSSVAGGRAGRLESAYDQAPEEQEAGEGRARRATGPRGRRSALPSIWASMITNRNVTMIAPA